MRKVQEIPEVPEEDEIRLYPNQLRMFTSLMMHEVYMEESEGEEASDVGEMDTDSLEGGSDVDVTGI